ncbi:MAG TPA: peptidylprolyl isomerase [Flavisolibacter sp.]|nr:peptidylprolyl isomerase [Flavisolibacter sp.]
MKNIVSFFLFLFVGGVTPAVAQTLFTIGKDTVTVAQFVTAFQKNNSAKDPQGIKGYRELYIAARLKVQEAKDLGLDTSAQFISDFKALREQILPTYLNDEEALSQRIREAFQRGRKDIHLSHIFISTGGDTVRAAHRAAEAYQQLKGGVSFAEVARRYSDDPSVKENGGDLHFITVFTLPYELENLAYATKPGTISNLFRSGSGYHIFRNLGETPAVGRMKAAQILVAYPPGAANEEKIRAKRLADSLYVALGKGSDFGILASRFSNDAVSAASNGLMQEFGRGQYDPLFEQQAYALQRDGALSKPFETDFGWHIVKRVKLLPPATVLDAKSSATLREQVLQSDWAKVAEKALVQKVLLRVPFGNTSLPPESLWLLTDSILKSVSPAALDTSRHLGRMGHKNITLGEWIDHARVHRFGGGMQMQYSELFWKDFIPAQALAYYKENLEEFNPAFKAQMEEFKDGNLFFEIMQQKVWGASQTDTAALRKWYAQNTSNYKWGKSADAVVFYASDAASAAAFRKRLSPAPSRWKVLIADYSNQIVADSNRFDNTAIPNAMGTALKGGMITAPLLNNGDNTVSFAYILRVYPEGGQRSFDEARSLVTGDYQAALEKTWVEELKVKYRVVVNEAAWNALQRQ